jgi:uncharacterized protein (DUF2147 family)
MKLLLLSLSLFLFTGSSFKSDDIIGLWLDESQKLIVECYKFDTKYYARIKWFKNENKKIEKFSPHGLPKSQWINYKVMEHFIFNGEYWTDGTIHQIKKGTSYDATIHMNNPNSIVVRGYVLVSLLGEDVNFSRYNGGLPKQE